MRIILSLLPIFAAILAFVADVANAGAIDNHPPPSEGLVPLTNGDISVQAVKYWMSTFAADAQYADYYCRQSGRQLLSIETDQEQREIQRFLEVYNLYGLHWTSGSDISGEGTWVWGSGEKIYYNNFEPGNETPTSNCLAIAGVQATALRFKWLKLECKEEQGFICEAQS